MRHLRRKLSLIGVGNNRQNNQLDFNETFFFLNSNQKQSKIVCSNSQLAPLPLFLFFIS